MAGLACSAFTGLNKQYFQCLAMTGIIGKQWLTVEAVTKSRKTDRINPCGPESDKRPDLLHEPARLILL